VLSGSVMELLILMSNMHLIVMLPPDLLALRNPCLKKISELVIFNLFFNHALKVALNVE
jgi:hypothetical protein